ncbi:MAG: hypothetical protein RL042_2157 [Nitrospirota bacterium]
MGSKRNRFESLSLLAAREQWCWNLVCTTCGHMVFRWGLTALAKGVHPDDPEWLVHWGPEQTSTRLARVHGPMPPPSGWPESEQRAVQEAVRGCRLELLAGESRFPDWLGHLGVLLRYTEDAERDNLLLTRELVPQLAGFVESGSSADTMLRQRLDAKRPLGWSDLEVIERCYHGPRPHRGAQ